MTPFTTIIKFNMKKKEKVTYYKRARGILKKCIEISTKCNQDVYFFMLDKDNKRIFELTSSPSFNLEAVTKAREEKSRYEYSRFFNTDLELLKKNMTPHQFQQVETTHKKMLREMDLIVKKI